MFLSARPSTDFLWITFHHQDRSNSIICKELDNTTVLLSLNLQDDHALYAYWKSNSSTIPNENASSCDDLNLTDDDSDCWQMLTDNDSILNPVWTDNSSQHTGLKTFTISGIQHTLPTDNFTILSASMGPCR